MKLLQSLIPECIYIISSIAVVIGSWSLMGWEYGLIILGAFGLSTVAYLNAVMTTTVE